MEKFLALSQEKQATIRNAALACFARHGYEKTSINDIAVAAGISKASIFQYFGNKQTLYQYLFDYCAAQMKQAYNQQLCGLSRCFVCSERTGAGNGRISIYKTSGSQQGCLCQSSCLCM